MNRRKKNEFQKYFLNFLQDFSITQSFFQKQHAFAEKEITEPYSICMLLQKSVQIDQNKETYSFIHLLMFLVEFSDCFSMYVHSALTLLGLSFSVEMFSCILYTSRQGWRIERIDYLSSFGSIASAEYREREKAWLSGAS